MTKAKKLRARDRRRREDLLWSATMPPAPPHILAYFAEEGPNVTSIVRESWTKAPSHVVDFDVQRIDRDVVKALSQRAAIARFDDRAETIAAMQREYPKRWGVRGQAKEVAERWSEYCGDRVSVRTVQNYFKASRTKT